MKPSSLKQAVLLTLASLIPPPGTYAEQPGPASDNSVTDNTPIAFTLNDLNKQPHHLADYRGKVLLINFWASWCTPCLLEMPGIKRLESEFSDKDFTVLTINISDDPRRIRETLRRLQIELTVLLDHEGKMFADWHGRMLPTSYLLDREGRILKRFVGEVDWGDEEVTTLINSLLQN